MTITFGAILFAFLFIFQKIRKNNFFILHTFVMVGVAYFLENYQGWRVALFSKNALMLFVLFHLPLINLFTFLAYGRDKGLAKRGEWRIPEIQLHTLELLGGTIGAILGQKIFHHKNKKKTYLATFWFVVLLQLGVIFYILKYFNIL